MSDLDGQQPPLFDYPASQRTGRKTPPRGEGKPSYTRFRPARRQLCDDCIRDIHTRGANVAPLPLSVRWRRTYQGDVALLCPRHKDERVEADGPG